MLRRKREGSLQRRVALLLLLGVINLPVQEALAADRDAQAMNPARAAIVISANRGFGVTPRGGAGSDDCPCHCVFPCAALHSPLLPSLVNDFLPCMIACPTAGELPAAWRESPTMEPAVRPPIA
jgi:hypothetical protein